MGEVGTDAQPRERKAQQWPLSRDNMSDVGWSRFPANGKDGIFLAVMALSWWAPAIRSLQEVAFFEEAVTDICWVVGELIRIKTSQVSPTSLSPPQDEPHHHQHDLTSHPSPPSSRSPASSRPPVSTSGVHTHTRSKGKRTVRPTWKALANS